ncbi:MAG: calcium/sodium antiporter [Bacilli bacterium]|nr:calcium/sodium antiporter [Bacilli bacterium]
MLVVNIIILLVSLFLIIKFSDMFVDAATSIAEGFKVPKIVIALTVAAFCTCAPELAISFNSISSGNADMTLANVIGSSIINILLIIGISAIVKPIKLKERTIRKELPFLLMITTVFYFLLNDSFFNTKAINSLSRVDGIILIIWFIAFCLYIFSIARRHKEDSIINPKFTKKQAIIRTIIALVGIIVTSDLIVDSAVYVAEALNISQKIIAMTIIVIGTSLPELTITILSAKKGEFDMAIGNIIGTNIFNICIVLGLPITIFGTVSSTAFGLVDLMVVLLAALLLFIFGTSDKKLTRREGIIMLLVVVVYYLYIFLQ